MLGVAASLAATGCADTVSGAPVGPPPSPDRPYVITSREALTLTDGRFLQGGDPAQAGPPDATVNLDDAVLPIG